jgi:uncharacterized protein (TIGR02186 family)
MLRVGLVLILFCAFVSPVYGQERLLTVDVAEERVDITTGFTGVSLTVFGEAKTNGKIAIVLRGPDGDVIVRKKSRVLGTWMNRSSVRYEDVPLFYDFALSDAEKNFLTIEGRKIEGIGFAALKYSSIDDGVDEKTNKDFQQALIRNKRDVDLFPVGSKRVHFLSDSFFRTQFYLPANVPVGEYVIETFLIDNGRVLDKTSNTVSVAHIGFSSSVYRFAHSYSLAYAMIIVLIAVVAGWLSNAVRRNDK